MIKVDGIEVKATIFPDKTSQVWKLPEELFQAKENNIVWDFESEAEFIHLAQLKELLSTFGNRDRDINLEIRYLPYARQDKYVANDATFALRVFCKLINTLNFSKIEIFDPHSDLSLKEIRGVKAIDPFPNIAKVLAETQAVAVYPDAGAATRYGKLIAQMNQVVFKKIRNQLTGEIEGIGTDDEILPLHYLIVDDICDGGRTFIEAAKVLYAGGAKEVSLYISHGLFTKGLNVLREAGIKRIFTKNGEV